MADNTELGESQRRTGLWVAIGLLLLVFGFTVALTLPTYVNRSNPFWFVGMLVIFGAALSLIAVVFRWLGLASRDEAFALPSGSVRTLLAIGVMVLFAVFGLDAVSVSDDSLTHRLSDQPMATATAPAAPALLDAEIKRYERQGMAVVVDSVGAASAALKLYRIDRVKPPETTDMQKQVLTALVTLLTSVVSFYFGSRSVEAARDSKDKAAAGAGGTGGGAAGGTAGGTGGGGLTAAVDAQLKRIDSAIADGSQRLAALQSEPAATGNEAALATALALLAAQAPALGADRSKLGALLADVRAGGAQGTAVDEALVALQQRVDAFTQTLAEAEALVAKG